MKKFVFLFLYIICINNALADHHSWAFHLRFPALNTKDPTLKCTTTTAQVGGIMSISGNLFTITSVNGLSNNCPDPQFPVSVNVQPAPTASQPTPIIVQSPSGNSLDPECYRAWNELVVANQVENVKILVVNDCGRIHNAGWKPGTGISNPNVCRPPWYALENAKMLQNAGLLISKDCAVMHENGF